MTTKTIELRDKGTFIPMLAIKLEPGNEADRYLLSRAGYGVAAEDQGKYILLARIEGGNLAFHYSPHEWPNRRTFGVAHEWIIEHFDEIESGAVVDVEFILGETGQPKISEALA